MSLRWGRRGPPPMLPPPARQPPPTPRGGPWRRPFGLQQGGGMGEGARGKEKMEAGDGGMGRGCATPQRVDEHRQMGGPPQRESAAYDIPRVVKQCGVTTWPAPPCRLPFRQPASDALPQRHRYNHTNCPGWSRSQGPTPTSTPKPAHTPAAPPRRQQPPPRPATPLPVASLPPPFSYPSPAQPLLYRAPKNRLIRVGEAGLEEREAGGEERKRRGGSRQPGANRGGEGRKEEQCRTYNGRCCRGRPCHCLLRPPLRAPGRAAAAAATTAAVDHRRGRPRGGAPLAGASTGHPRRC